MSNIAATLPHLLTVDETAQALRLSPRAVRRRILAGELHAARLGRGPCAPVRITEAELARYLATSLEGDERR
jgi:excisionase family DNA binding protein